MASPVYGASQTTYQNILRKTYKMGVEDVTFPDNEFTEWVPKNEQFMGLDYEFTLKYSNNQSISNIFGNTVSQNGNYVGATSQAQFARFTVTQITKYSTANIFTQVMRNSENKEGGVVKAFTEEMDSTIRGFARDTEVAMLNANGSGVLGVVTYATSSPYAVTLSDPNTVNGFEVGQYLELAPAGSTTRSAILSPTALAPCIVAVDRVNGLLYVGPPNSPGISNAVSLASFYGSAPTNSGILVSRLGGMFNEMFSVASWLPGNTLTSTDSFCGVNRSTDATRLAGQWFDGSTLTVIEAVIEGLNRFAQQGSRPDTVFCSYKNLAQIAKNLEGSVRREAGGEGEFGFSSFVATVGKGEVRFIGASAMPNNLLWALRRDTWTLKSAGPAIGVIDVDAELIRNWNTDSYQIRVGGYMNLICENPLHNGVIYVQGEV